MKMNVTVNSPTANMATDLSCAEHSGLSPDQSTLINSLEAPSWVVTLNGQTVFVNPALTRLLGYSISEMIGQSVHSFIVQENKEVITNSLKKRGHGISESYKMSFRHKLGWIVTSRLAASPIKNSEGQIIASIAMIFPDEPAPYFNSSDSTLKCGNLQLNCDQYSCSVNGEAGSITPFSFKLLKFFVMNKNRVVTREELMEKVWEQPSQSDRLIDRHVVVLRHLLKNFDGSLRTLRGVGYILQEDTTPTLT
jgi:PAS domain S-box-containing protein